MRAIRTIIALGAFVVAACGLNDAATATPVAAPLAQEAGGWEQFEPVTITINGETLDPTCSDAPGANPAFKFWARRGVSNNVVVFFDGGGACWDDLTCSVPRFADGRGEGDGFYKAELLPSDNPNRMGGIFDLNNPRNPLRDWSFVFVPYCTGDVHSGSNTATYTDPDTGEAFTIQHRGADNFRVVLEWMRANFTAPDQIVVAGSSAGAYGATTHYARIRDAFPGGRALMLGDAGQGVTTQDFLDRRNTTWRYQLPDAVFGADAALTADVDVVGRLAAHYPNDRFAQYTTAQDITQTAFYALMGAPRACRAWTQKMATDLEHRQATSNFRSYLARGNSHTILRTRLFYSERSGGEPFSEWLAAALTPDGDGWDNEACERCTRPPDDCRF